MRSLKFVSGTQYVESAEKCCRDGRLDRESESDIWEMLQMANLEVSKYKRDNDFAIEKRNNIQQ